MTRAHHQKGEFVKRCNNSMVDLEPVLSESEQQVKLARELWHLGEADEATLRRMIEKHAEYTNRPRLRDPREVGRVPAALREDLPEGIPPRARRARRRAEEGW